MTSKIRIISDFPLFILAIFGTISTVIGCSIVIWIVGIEGIIANQSEIIPIQITFFVLLVIFLFAMASSISSSICVLTLSKESISLMIPFKKKQIFPYTKYPFILHGCYFHGNIAGAGKWVHYIVFSQDRIPSDVLNHINKLRNTQESFKIRCTKKNYTVLCAVLPDKYRLKMEISFRSAGLL